MNTGTEKIRHQLTRNGILVCQTLFIGIALSAGIALCGLLDSWLALPLLGGTFIFNTIQLYLRALEETQADRPITKGTLALVSAAIAGAGIAICIGIFVKDYGLALRPLPIIVLTPVLMTWIQATDQAARSKQ